jgi:hypothetical protein
MCPLVPRGRRSDATAHPIMTTTKTVRITKGHDNTYLTVQIQGHEALLQLQEEFLGNNPVYSADMVHIALIATAFIKNHLYILKHLKNGTL